MTRYSQTGSTAESEGVNSCDIGQKSSISVRFKYDQPGMIWCRKNETDAKNTPMVKLKGSSTWCLCPLCSMLDCRFSDGWMRVEATWKDSWSGAIQINNRQYRPGPLRSNSPLWHRITKSVNVVAATCPTKQRIFRNLCHIVL